MANSRLCSIPDCGKPVASRGFCRSHYSRFLKHGDPLGGRTGRGEARSFFTNVVMNYEGDDCLIWPYSRDRKGYGRINITGTPEVVSRVVCKKAHGDPIGMANEAAHSCSNGHLGCVTKRHLSWKTRAENDEDKMANGTTNRGERSPSSKLKAEDVLAIRSKIGTMRSEDIALMFGVGARHIRAIRDRKSWAHLI